jgi:hypothetical protein
MRKAAWPILTLVLMAVSFAVGRKTAGFHPLPAIAATLPGVEADFGRELDIRIRERFPIGTNEETLIAHLAGEGFVPNGGDATNPTQAPSYATACFARISFGCSGAPMRQAFSRM